MNITVFNNIDWVDVLESKNVDWIDYTKYAAKADSNDYILFKQAYDKRYYNNGDKGLYYPTYVRLIATAKALGKI